MRGTSLVTWRWPCRRRLRPSTSTTGSSSSVRCARKTARSSRSSGTDGPRATRAGPRPTWRSSRCSCSGRVAMRGASTGSSGRAGSTGRSGIAPTIAEATIDRALASAHTFYAPTPGLARPGDGARSRHSRGARSTPRDRRPLAARARGAPRGHRGLRAPLRRAHRGAGDGGRALDRAHVGDRRPPTRRRTCTSTSAEPESGKTRLLEVLHELVREPISTMNISDAALFRVIEAKAPTLLFDEVDSIFNPKARERGLRDDLRALLNAGYRRGAARLPDGRRQQHDARELRGLLREGARRAGQPAADAREPLPADRAQAPAPRRAGRGLLPRRARRRGDAAAYTVRGLGGGGDRELRARAAAAPRRAPRSRERGLAAAARDRRARRR